MEKAHINYFYILSLFLYCQHLCGNCAMKRRGEKKLLSCRAWTGLAACMDLHLCSQTVTQHAPHLHLPARRPRSPFCPLHTASGCDGGSSVNSRQHGVYAIFTRDTQQMAALCECAIFQHETSKTKEDKTKQKKAYNTKKIEN